MARDSEGSPPAFATLPILFPSENPRVISPSLHKQIKLQQLNIISVIGNGNSGKRRSSMVTKCESTSTNSSSEAGQSDGSSSRLAIGSAIIVVEAPKTIKTAASVPCLKVNTGLVKPGDVGRIVARKPKDVWAVRLAIGTYLIDGKHFKPLDLD